MATPGQLSHEAYQSVVDKLPEMRRRVYEAIKAAGPRGATADEICQRLHAHGNTHGRTTELERLGLIRAIGVRKTRSGRRATVYVVNPIQPEQLSLGIE